MSFSLCSFWLSLEQRLPGNSALEVLAFPSHTKSSLGPCQECNPSTSEECSWLLKAGSLIRAVEKGWKEHQCLPSFLLELFPAEISSQPPSKDIPQLHCHFYCLPTQEIHPQGWRAVSAGWADVRGGFLDSVTHHWISYLIHVGIYTSTQCCKQVRKTKTKT